jgi:hypothetical protein
MDFLCLEMESVEIFDGTSDLIACQIALSLIQMDRIFIAEFQLTSHDISGVIL